MEVRFLLKYLVLPKTTACKYAWGWCLIVLMGLLAGGGLHAQPPQYAVALQVTYPGVDVLRADAVNWLPLAQGAIAPVGAGDQIRTDESGRAFVTFSEGVSMLLLPQSTFTLNDFDFPTADTAPVIDATFEGVLIAETPESFSPERYTLQTLDFQVMQPARLFALWSRAGVPDVAAVSRGELLLSFGSQGFRLNAFQAFWASDDVSENPLTLLPPMNIARLEAEINGCMGKVRTQGEPILRVRSGSTLEFTPMGGFDDDAEVRLLGITESGLWYRVQFLSDFGWVQALAVENTCTDLPVYPDIFQENAVYGVNVTAAERALLQPFFGTAEENRWFYRTEVAPGEG